MQCNVNTEDHKWLLFCGGSGSHGIATEILKASFAEFLKKNIDTALPISTQTVKGERQTDNSRTPSHITCVIPITDNGGSSQDLIDYFGGPAIGDCRNMILHAAGTIVELVLRYTEDSSKPGAFSADTLQYSAAVVKALKTREADKKALMATFAALVHGGHLSGSTVEQNHMARSRRRIESAMACYWKWEDSLASKATTTPSQPQTSVDALHAAEEFILPPAIGSDAPKSSPEGAAGLTADTPREPVYYIGASTGNVLLFAIFLEALETYSQQNSPNDLNVRTGVIETACNIFWDEVLCIPALVNEIEERVAKRRNQRAFPLLEVVPSLDFYIECPFQDATNQQQSKYQQEQEGGVTGEPTIPNLPTIVEHFLSQEDRALSIPFAASLHPLPYARLDTLLVDGGVIEGQKEFSYGLGPTPHGTPLTSRSPSIGYMGSKLSSPNPKVTMDLKLSTSTPTTLKPQIQLPAQGLPKKEFNTPLASQHSAATNGSFSSASSTASQQASPNKNAISKTYPQITSVAHAPVCVSYSIVGNQQVSSLVQSDHRITVGPSCRLAAILRSIKTELDSCSAPNAEITTNRNAYYRHVIFSRGSFYTSLGASCVPVAEDLASIVRSFPPKSEINHTTNSFRMSFILNGSVDRETSLFFEPPADKSQQRKGDATTGELCVSCPVKSVVEAFTRTVLQCGPFTNLTVYGVRGSRWQERCKCNTSDGWESAHHPKVHWVAPKGSKFSSSNAKTSHEASATATGITSSSSVATMYDDAALVRLCGIPS